MTPPLPPPGDAGQPFDEDAELVDRSQVKLERPGTKDLSVRAYDHTIEWRAKFKDEIRELCRLRGVQGPVPATLMTAVLKSRGMLLVWPGEAKDPRGFEVNAKQNGQRIFTTLTEAFVTLKVALPRGTSVSVPVRPYKSPKYGQCLALYFSEGTFLGGRWRDAATGQQHP
jgi:hypothetical protein